MMMDVEVKMGEVVDDRVTDQMGIGREGFVNEINTGYTPGQNQSETLGYLAIAPPEFVRGARRGLLYA
jgi:hypothetical protein